MGERGAQLWSYSPPSKIPPPRMQPVGKSPAQWSKEKVGGCMCEPWTQRLVLMMTLVQLTHSASVPCAAEGSGDVREVTAVCSGTEIKEKTILCSFPLSSESVCV